MSFWGMVWGIVDLRPFPIPQRCRLWLAVHSYGVNFADTTPPVLWCVRTGKFSIYSFPSKHICMYVLIFTGHGLPCCFWFFLYPI